MLLQITLIEPGKAIGQALEQIGASLPKIFNQAGIRRGDAIQKLQDPIVSTAIGEIMTAAETPDEGLTQALTALQLDPQDTLNRELLGGIIQGQAARVPTEREAEIGEGPEQVAAVTAARAQETQARFEVAGAQGAQASFARAAAEALIRNDVASLQGVLAAQQAVLGSQLTLEQTARVDTLVDILDKDPTAAAIMGAAGGEAVAQYLMGVEIASLDLLAKAAGAGEEITLLDALSATIEAGQRVDELVERAGETSAQDEIDQIVQEIDRTDEAVTAVRAAVGLPSLSTTVPIRDDTGIFGHKGELTWERIEVPDVIPDRIRRQYATLVTAAVAARATSPEAVAGIRELPIFLSLSEEQRAAFERQVDELYGVKLEKAGEEVEPTFVAGEETVGSQFIRGETSAQLRRALTRIERALATGTQTASEKARLESERDEIKAILNERGANGGNE